jgi:hypothetical protein
MRYTVVSYPLNVIKDVKQTIQIVKTDSTPVVPLLEDGPQIC